MLGVGATHLGPDLRLTISRRHFCLSSALYYLRSAAPAEFVTHLAAKPQVMASHASAGSEIA